MTIVKVFDQTVPFVSGYSMRSRYITDSLQALGADLHVFSSPIFEYGNLHEEINGVKYTRTQQTPWNKRTSKPLIKEYNVIQSLAHTLTTEWPASADVIHAHSSLLNGVAASRAARRYDVPFLYEARAFWEDASVDQGRTVENGFRYRLIRNAETRIFQRANHITVICEGLRNDVIARGFHPDKVSVVPNGVDTERFRPTCRNEELARALGVNDKRVVGFIGSFFKFEGLDLLVEAAQQIVKQSADVHFLIVGAGDEEQNIHQLTKDLGMEKHITFTGRVDHNLVREYYSVIDFLVYPRRSRRITELVTPLKTIGSNGFEKACHWQRRWRHCGTYHG